MNKFIAGICFLVFSSASMGVELNGLKIGMSVSEYKKKFPGTICYYGRNCDILDQRMTGKLNTLAGQPVVRISVDFKDEQKLLVIQYMLGCGAPLSQVQRYLVGLLGDPSPRCQNSCRVT